jgi:micrococcal nuclease
MISCILRAFCMDYTTNVIVQPISTLPKIISSDILVHPNPTVMDYLDAIEYKDTIPFIPEITSGKVIKVYDGDTITIASKMPYPNSPIFRFSVRLSGIDSPEMKTKSSTEKCLATISRDALSAKIMGKLVILKNVSFEKYGRLLADVYLDDLDINQWMLDHKYAVEYDGGTKHKPSEWTA